MKTEIEIIAINWHKVEFKPSDFYNRKWDYGLYQIYGNHNAYGQNSLLYLGKARYNTFTQRLLNEKRLHSDFNETTAYPEYVRLCYIAKSNEQQVVSDEEQRWGEYIDIAEHILISTHTPALNSQLDFKLFKIGEKYANRNILILNLGDRGNLLPEITTLKNSYMYYNHETPFGYEAETE